jgi:hypothetical protein
MSRQNVVRVVSTSRESYDHCVRLRCFPRGCQGFYVAPGFQVKVYLLHKVFARVHLYVSFQSTTSAHARHPHPGGAY